MEKPMKEKGGECVALGVDGDMSRVKGVPTV